MPGWFKPKRYGYGATPVNWQGWLLVIAFVAAVIGLWLATIGPGGPVSLLSGPFFIWFIGTALLVAVLWAVSRRTTSGEWRWRWNGHAR